jgi:cell pole-organizing protein PopZ
MAQPNVVREPSMDEILASIRRIIESNDPVPSGAANSMPEPEGFSGNAANDDMEDVPLTIDDSFGRMAEIDRSQADDMPARPLMQAREAEQAPQPKSLSLADVAARVRAASERNPGLRELAPKVREEDAYIPVSPVANHAVSQAASDDSSARIPHVTAPVAAASIPQPDRATVDWSEIEQREPMAAPVSPVEASASIAPRAGPEATATSLISVDAGQQVARSFQDLAVAVDEAERRSYEEIASDLLRPMLQEWLDENLPTLVERLVREEIERVARGNRR